MIAAFAPSSRPRRRAVLPLRIRSLVRRLPRVPSSAVVAIVLNLLLRRWLPAEVLRRLAERPFAIDVRDAGLSMAFRYSGRRFVPVPPAGGQDLRFVIQARHFEALAEPEGDPVQPFLDDVAVIGDQAIAAPVREAVRRIDVGRARRLLRRAARAAERA